jgi:hypothetical protein
MSHRRRDGAVVHRRDEGQPPQNGGDGGNTDDGSWLGLIQLLRSALARLPPPGGVPTADRNLKFTLSFNIVCRVTFHKETKFMCGLHIVYTLLSPAARRIVVEAINHCTVAVHQNGSTFVILLVRCYPSRPSSPGYGKAAARAHTSSYPGSHRIQRGSPQRTAAGG